MRVLFVISTMQAGGAERVMAILSGYFANFHDVTLLKFDSKPSFYDIDKRVKLIDLPYPMLKKGFFTNFVRRIKKFFYQRKLIKDGNFDLVISFMDSTNINVILSNIFINKPLFISEHSSSSFLKPKLWVWLRRLLYPYATGLTVLTKSDFDYYKFVKNKTVMYNPMFEASKKGLPKENIILFVGRLVALKGCDVFLKSISLIDKEILKDYRIVIAGSGDEKQRLDLIAHDLHIDVEFVGQTEDIASLYERSKIIVSSSKTEGLPNVLIESIFFDCARIATATTGASELIEDGVDGFLVPIDDTKALSEKIEILVNDDALREKFVKNANLKADSFKIEQIYKKWMEFIGDSVKI
ncbi:glycosyltransferase [Campylobacter sp. RM15925]|uniref:glycosyltransferase n=1 Tax=Campylobacter sp. RM15925 TaxID=1705724 RepID=UPI001474B9F0|nr:glycosyltransferase [Campylobacter sp. RM15925]